MGYKVEIERITEIEEYLDGLSELLMNVVEDGASIGFLPPISKQDAMQYWKNVLSPEVVLLVAKSNNQIAGTVQLHLSMKQNGGHRAEIAKLMAHSEYRRMGIGRLLMEKAEAVAKQAGRSLIVLDTREGDASNNLYRSLGYIQAGYIPNYAKSAGGELDATIIYYKNI